MRVEGKSGTKRRDERTGLDELYTLLETGKAGTVSAFDVSRLYRVTSKAEIGTFCDMVLELQIPVVTFSRIYWPNETENDQLAADLKAAGAFINEIVRGKLHAAKNRHIQYDASYGGGWVPFGYVVVGMGDATADRKFYQEYKPHSELIRHLFRRFKELGGNLRLLARELEEIDFRFPPFEQGITPHVALKPDVDGSYPLRTREAIISILTNRAYIGWYEYGNTLISRTAHAPIVPLDDFVYAYWMLLGTDIDGEPHEHKPRERRYGGATALLDGIVRSDSQPVYVVGKNYVARAMHNGFHRDVLVVSASALDIAFAKAMVVSIAKLEQEHKNGLHNAIYDRVTALQQEQEKLVTDYSKTLARIDKEIANEEMAQQASKRLGDLPGYEAATKQLVTLRKDRLAIEAKAQQANSEAGELAECHSLIDCAVSQWEGMPVSRRKRLVKLLVESANLTEASPHFVRLDVVLGTPIECPLTLYLHRKQSSRQPWNEQENETLKQLYPRASKQAVMEALPTHTWTAIVQQAMAKSVRRAGTGHWRDGTEPDSSYAVSSSLAYADYELMRQTGARVERPVWTMYEKNLPQQEWGPSQR